jgi:Zn ribbon nucleic-acid-binding protein
VLCIILKKQERIVLANFIKHSSCPNCGSKDNLAIYEDGSYFCFSHCGYKSISEEYKTELQTKHKIKPEKVFERTKEDMEIKPSTKPAISDEENNEIKTRTTIQANEFRGIRDEVYKMFGVRHTLIEGEVTEQYYPVTQEGQLSGYKIREVPKDFRSKGRTGADCELFMQFKFNRGGKYVIICEGEVDSLSAYQMLLDYNNSKKSDFETAAVSPTTGANSKKQIAAQYKFLDSFDNIVLMYDNDKAGKEASEDLIKYLPKGKVRVATLRYKDPNEYLTNGKQKEFVSDFYNAKEFVPVGVLPSSGLYDRIVQQNEVAKIPFPPFMKKLNEMFIGGMPLGYIFNLAADTGVGKTTYVNEMIYYWIFHSPHKIGIVSMELDAGQYGEVLLSRHVSRKLALMPNLTEKLEYLGSDFIRQKSNELMKNTDGSDRFYLLDNRDGSIEEIENTIEELVVSCGCKVIVLDPLQDLLDGLSNEEQSLFMKWAKGFIKSHGVSFVFINHMRKSDNSGEMDIMGSSTIIKSAAANIILKRDKLAEDPIVRNTTTVSVPKNRVCGITGSAGAFYYDNETHTLHDLDDWLNNQ